ncbi:MAG: O-antigen ligase family protein [Chloroflexi bacterium]|nr:O-antigen ligase family protein [Chloroflexota bacterium]
MTFREAEAQRPATGRPVTAAPAVRTGSGLQRALADPAVRFWVAIWVEVALVGSYLLIRTAHLPRSYLIAWAIMAGVVGLVAPASGLVGLVAIAPFTEPLSFSRELGLKPVLILPITAGVLLRQLSSWIGIQRVPRLQAPLVLAALLALGAALGVLTTFNNLGPKLGGQAAQLWLPGIGGGVLILLAAYWAGRNGWTRPFWVAVGAATIGGVLSLIEFVDRPLIRNSPIAWMLRGEFDPSRITGIIPSPNGVAALMILPAGVLIAVVLFARSRAAKLLAGLLTMPLIVALFLTLSRAPMLGLGAIAVIFALRFSRALGLALVVLGLVAAAVLLPPYLRERAETTNIPVTDNRYLVASDDLRLQAWASSLYMWREEPLIGHGFQSYRELHGYFGDPILRAPHNEWLRFFAEGGLLSGVTALLFVAFTAARLASSRSLVATGALGAFIGWVLAASFNNPLLYVQVNAIVFTIVGIGLAAAGRIDGDAAGRPAARAPVSDPGRSAWSESSAT